MIQSFLVKDEGKTLEFMEYEDFLISRRKAIANVIRDGFERLCQKDS